MKIKHFSGYGTVTATKIAKKNLIPGHDLTEMKIKVSGNHEVGLIRENDNWTVRKWLLERFEKSGFDTYREMAYKVTDFGYENGVEYAVYTFIYGKDLPYVL